MTGIGTAPTALTASLNLSGVNVVTNVSGQTVVTNVSGQTVVATVSGNVGHLIYDGSGGVWREWVAAVSGGNRPVVAIGGPDLTSVATTLNNTSDAVGANRGVVAIGINYGYDPTAGTWARLRTTASGQGISGATTKLVIAFSGDAIKDYGGSLQTAASPIVTSASGGIELSSGVVIQVQVRGLNVNSGALYVGGTGGNAPFSGAGLVLAPTDPPVTLKVDNLNDIRVFAQASGDRVSFVGTVG